MRRLRTSQSSAYSKEFMESVSSRYVQSTLPYMATYHAHRLGRHTASKWYKYGCRTLDDIKARKGGIKLSTCQEIGLEHYAGMST